MRLPETTTHSFVVRIETDADRNWHGHISHVPAGERRYFRDLGEVSHLIEATMLGLGVDLGRGWPVWRWLQRTFHRRHTGGQPWRASRR